MDHLWRESTLGRSEFWVWNHKPLTGSPRLHSPWKRFFHGVLWAGKYFISVFYTFKSKNCSFRKKWTHAFGNWSSLSPELVTVELASADVIHAVIWFLGSLSNHDFYWPLSCLWTSITSQYQHFRDSKCSSLRVDQGLILSERVTHQCFLWYTCSLSVSSSVCLLHISLLSKKRCASCKLSKWTVYR